MEMRNKCSLKVKDLYLAEIDGVTPGVVDALSTGHRSRGKETSAATTRVSPLSRRRRSAKSSPRKPQRKGRAFHSSLNLATSGQGCHRSSRPRKQVASRTFGPVRLGFSSSSSPGGVSFRRCNRTGASTGASISGGGIGGLMKSIGGGGPKGSMNSGQPFPFPLLNLPLSCFSTISLWILPSCSPHTSTALATFSDSSAS
mmetsp:Transcript_130961/g.292934  ORF Transcript_130961/g.292934 Transcript_130961/m.292934 type:complete len:200 (+) Transcript_130961:1978-2577(+)